MRPLPDRRDGPWKSQKKEEEKIVSKYRRDKTEMVSTRDKNTRNHEHTIEDEFHRPTHEKAKRHSFSRSHHWAAATISLPARLWLSHPRLQLFWSKMESLVAKISHISD